jgi:exocyst complex component 4
VKDGWEFVIDPDVREIFLEYSFITYSMQFNNVDLALQLLDQSSVGKDMDSFRRTKDTLSKALKGSVDSMPVSFRIMLLHSSFFP